jgi:hypothetical protein
MPRSPLADDSYRQAISFTKEEWDWIQGPAKLPQGFSATIRQMVDDQISLYGLPQVVAERLKQDERRLKMDRRTFIQHVLHQYSETLQRGGR